MSHAYRWLGGEEPPEGGVAFKCSSIVVDGTERDAWKESVLLLAAAGGAIRAD